MIWFWSFLKHIIMLYWCWIFAWIYCTYIIHHFIQYYVLDTRIRVSFLLQKLKYALLSRNNYANRISTTLTNDGTRIIELSFLKRTLNYTAKTKVSIKSSYDRCHECDCFNIFVSIFFLGKKKMYICFYWWQYLRLIKLLLHASWLHRNLYFHHLLVHIS